MSTAKENTPPRTLHEPVAAPISPAAPSTPPLSPSEAPNSSEQKRPWDRMSLYSETQGGTTAQNTDNEDGTFNDAQDKLYAQFLPDFPCGDPSSQFSRAHGDEDEHQSVDSSFVPLFDVWDETVSQTASKVKEISPFKRRRKASSPEEIAQLLRASEEDEISLAGQDDVSDNKIYSNDDEEDAEPEPEDLPHHHAMDLIPTTPIIDSSTANDITTFNTPIKANETSPSAPPRPSLTPDKDTQNGLPTYPHTPQTNTIKHFSKTTVLKDATSPMRSPLFAAQLSMTLIIGTTNMNSAEEAAQEKAQDGDLLDGGEGADVVEVQEREIQQEQQPGPEQDEKQAQEQEQEPEREQEHPLFITILAFLPQSMFWATAAPVAKYACKAYDVVVERMTGLKLDGDVDADAEVDIDVGVKGEAENSSKSE